MPNDPIRIVSSSRGSGPSTPVRIVGDTVVPSLTVTGGTGMQYLSLGLAVALGYDNSTHERGFLVKFINRIGHTSIKGELVSCSTTADREVIVQTNEYDTIGVIQEAGIAEGDEMWVWTIGSVCQVLFKDTIAATRGNLLIAADTNGRAIDIANPGSGLPATDTHFKECGHVMETKLAGINVLVLASLHFN